MKAIKLMIRKKEIKKKKMDKNIKVKKELSKEESEYWLNYLDEIDYIK